MASAPMMSVQPYGMAATLPSKPPSPPSQQPPPPASPPKPLSAGGLPQQPPAEAQASQPAGSMEQQQPPPNSLPPLPSPDEVKQDVATFSQKAGKGMKSGGENLRNNGLAVLLTGGAPLAFKLVPGVKLTWGNALLLAPLQVLWSGLVMWGLGFTHAFKKPQTKGQQGQQP